MGQRNNENKLLEEVGRVVLSTKDKVETWWESAGSNLLQSLPYECEQFPNNDFIRAH
jgi:hypothetical protein